MNQPSSPVFDAPEFPALRRVVPLPKRRRYEPQASPESSDVSSGFNLGLQVPSLRSEPTTEELLAHASESLSSLQFADPSKYLPILGSVHELLKATLASAASDVSGSGKLTGWGVDSEPDDTDEHDRDGFLRQHGNIKKRKVPINAAQAAAQRGGEDGSVESVDYYVERSTVAEPDYPSSPVSSRKSKLLSKAALAGLQYKFTLKQRKKQLAAVLGAITHGDTVALDQALTTTFPSLLEMTGDPKASLPVRLSKRANPRMARVSRALAQMSLNTAPSPPQFPSSTFDFEHHSATADRLVATKAEVATLRSRFETELSRQAAKIQKKSENHNPANNKNSSPRQKKSANNKNGANNNNNNGSPAPTGATSADPTLLGMPNGKASKNKKKKRNALAIASNPHHRRNYVPGRLLGSGNANAKPVDELYALPLRFLASELAAARGHLKRDKERERMTNPAEEWICQYCEYELFYGNEKEYRRAVNNRKKILRRRRRAERLAANVTSKVPDRNQEDEEYDDEDNEEHEYMPHDHDHDQFVSSSAMAGGEFAKSATERHESGNAAYG